MNTEDEAVLTERAIRVINGLDTYKEGDWRWLTIPARQRVDAAWMYARYEELWPSIGFGPAAIRTRVEYLKMVMTGDESVLNRWLDSHRFYWCGNCKSLRVGPTDGVKCHNCGLELTNQQDMAGLQREYILVDCYVGNSSQPFAAKALGIDVLDLRAMLLDEFGALESDN